MRRVPLGGPCPDLVDACRLAGDPAPKALTTEMAACDLGPVEPTAVCGGSMERSCIGSSVRRSGLQSFLPRGWGRGMQLVHHQTPRLHGRILVINTVLDTVRPIPWGPLCRHGGRPLTSAGFTRDTPWVPAPVASPRGPSAGACPAPLGAEHGRRHAAGSTGHPDLRGDPERHQVCSRSLRLRPCGRPRPHGALVEDTMRSCARVYVHFFSWPSSGRMGPGVDQIPLPQVRSAQASGPPLRSRGSLATRQGDHLGVCVSGDVSTVDMGPWFAVQGRFNAFCNTTRLDRLDCFGGHGRRRSQVCMGPTTGPLGFA